MNLSSLYSSQARFCFASILLLLSSLMPVFGQLRTTTSPDQYVCVNKAVGISTSPAGGTAPYTYSWAPATGLSATNVANPSASPTATTKYVVTITDASSNTITDSVTVFRGNFPPKIAVTPSADTICGIDTIQLNIENTTSCNTVGNECLTGASTADLGVGAFLSNSPIISPYHVDQIFFIGTPVRSNKKQFLYQPNELRSLGFEGVTNITSLGFFASSFAAWTYNEFTIKMGCSIDSVFLNNSYKTGLQTVFDPKTVTVPTGTNWTQHDFDRSFTWDGTSSIVVEICFVNTTDQGFNGPRVRFQNFTQNVTLSRTGQNSVCGSTTATNRIVSRPHTRFGNCRVMHETPLTYSWTPSGDVSNSTIYDPEAYVNATTDFILTATDTNGCEVKDTASIVSASDFNLTVPADTNLCAPDSFALTVTDNAGPGAVYAWKPASLIANPAATSTKGDVSALTEFTIEVKSSAGCSKFDTLVVDVLSPINLEILTPDSTICAGDSVAIKTTTDPAGCRISPTLCESPEQLQLGTNANAFQGAAVSPFGIQGINHNSQKKQLIIRQAELSGIGITDPAAISSIGINFNSLRGVTTYENFTIRIGCTDVDQFNFVGGRVFLAPVSTVYTPKTVTLTTGLNVFDFDNSFVWDGTSNIVIEFCFENTNALSFINDVQNVQTTGAGFATGLYSSGTGVCGATNGAFISFFRPDLYFGVCEAPPRTDLIYSWAPAAGLSNPNVPEPKASPAANTMYILTAEEPNSVCEEKDTINISVAANYTTTPSNDTTLCEAGALPVFVNNTATAPATISWEPASLFTNPSITNTTANLTVSEQLFARTDANGCVKLDTIDVIVNDPISIDITSDDDKICLGTTTQLNAEVGLACGISNDLGCAGTSNATPQTGTVFSTNSSSITPFISDDLSTRRQYLFRAAELVASGINTSSTISSVSLDINTLGFRTSFENFTIKMGCTSRNTMSSSFQPVQTVYEPKTFQISTGANLFVFDKQFNWDGVSNVIIEICYSNSGFANPFLINSTVDYYGTTYRSSLLASGPTSACNRPTGLPLNWRPVMEFSYCNYTGNYTYSWTPTNTLNSATINNPIARPDSSSTYYLEVTDLNNNCQYEDSIALVTTDFEVNAPNDTVICTSQGLQLSVQTDAEEPTYEWVPSPEVSDFQIPNPTVIVPFGNFYAVHVTDSSGCTLSDTMTVTYFPEPTIDITPDTTICRTDKLDVFVVGGITYSWSPTTALTDPNSGSPSIINLGNSTKYIVEITDQNDCLRYDSIQVDVHPSPTFDLGPDSAYCGDFNTTLSGGSGFLSYDWNTGATTASIDASPPGTFILNATDGFDCVIKDTVIMQLLPNPVTDLRAQYLVCENDSLQLDVTNANAVYTWSTGETTPQVVINESGEYWVEIFNGECTVNDTFNVSMLEFPVAVMEERITFCENDFPFGVPVTAGSDQYSYFWSNGVRANSQELAEPGSYTVRIVNGVDNCSILDTVDILRYCEPTFFIPNTFSPNNDLINDEFSIVARNIYDFDFQIFNRWGELVYQTDNPNFKWDGTLGNKPIAQGAYVWNLTYEERLSDGSFKEHKKRGDLFILR